jgi:hypothetical protein
MDHIFIITFKLLLDKEKNIIFLLLSCHLSSTTAYDLVR